ncbi:MAG: T9SS C-terminal target domain-containing protein [Haliscomenobacteraceae bacterium CHB4]|nr:T9SS C-terminal target domain-containing protein [Haliscomenobacteraceae bacterium CHB4]
MKKRLLFCLLLFLQAFVMPEISSARSYDYDHSPVANEATNCIAPPPGWLTVTNATPSSISLMWEQEAVNMLFKVEGYDVTGGFALPTYYTSNNTLTYNNLTSGNLCLFKVSATYCPANPQFEGGYVAAYQWVPKIIIDYVVELDTICKLGEPEQTSFNLEIQVCAAISENQYEPFTHAFIGRVKDYYDNTVDFAIAYNGTNAVVGETSDNPDVYFHETVPNTVVDCYMTTNGISHKVFTVSDLVGLGTEATLTLKFHGTYGFQSCNECSTGRSSSDSPAGFPSEGTAQSLENAAIIQVSPNPFTTSTTFRYTLPESGPVEISLYDAVGRQVKAVEKTALQPAGDYEMTVDGADLPDGVYFLHTITGQNRKVFALVKHE